MSLADDFPEVGPEKASLAPADGAEARTWGMLLHLSMLAGFLIPLGGFIAPIVIWQIKKDELPALDEHGKNAMNWLLSSLIYTLVSGVLILVIVGFFLLAILGVLGIVFPIVAALKANGGEVWPYPLTIRFLR